jgi:hypothetical protein
MRRWIAIFFLVLFPLQAVWAAAAPYCQHEQEPVSFHVGHHTHEHQGADHADGIDGKLPGMEDGDCQACHAFCSAMNSGSNRTGTLAIAPTPVIASVVTLPTPPQTQPERPNWHRFA